MRILHLGFEDHRRPGSGGGALRNHEINRRLVAMGHEIEVVAARYLGATTRREDGVVYRHVGLGHEYFTSLLSYQAALPFVVGKASRRSLPPDLIVEEFAPPWSTLGVPRWTRIPTVGMVQGYFAAEKAKQYHVPTRLLVGMERWGTRGHTQLIALSADLASVLAGVAPDAEVHQLGMGIDHRALDAALAIAPVVRVPRQIVFLGRLEVDQKGLDLLVEACQGLLVEEDAHLVIAGDGRGRESLKRMIEHTDFSERVRFVGRVGGPDKWRLLAESQISAVPSRYETFGLSALEALACGAPVVGFAIDSLRETVPTGTGLLVTPFDVDALRNALRALLRDPARSSALGAAGRTFSAGFSWEAVAAGQAAVYEAAGA